MNKKKIGFYLIVIFAVIIAIFWALATFSKPSMISIDSIRQSSCDEIASNFQDCRLKNQVKNWDYCTNLFIPFYIEKCL